ncbi:MAG: hypothetical protein ACOCRU_00080 [bacterium]
MTFVNGLLILVILVQLYIFNSTLKNQHAKLEEILSEKKVESAEAIIIDQENDILDSYIEKYNHYKKSNKEWMANLVLRNGFINNPANKDIFERYFTYLIGQAESDDEENSRKYLEDAYNAIMTFSEYVDLNDLKLIEKYLDKINRIRYNITEKDIVKIKKKNTDIINKLENFLIELKEDETNDEVKIKNILEEAALLETELRVEFFDEKLIRKYEELKKDYEKQATLKGEIITEGTYRNYNQKVVKDLQKMFQTFKDEEKNYKKGNKDIVELFDKKYKITSINNQYLNSETLTYFNYIYSYIFGLIKDEDKFRVTECMTMAKKDLLG